MDTLELEAAQKIIDVAFRKAAEMKLRPLTIALYDARGCLKAFQAQDGSVPLLRPEVAMAKAYGALATGAGSRTLRQRAADTPGVIAAFTAMAGGRLVPVPGGILIKDSQGGIVGAVGVSGDTSDNDEAVGIAGIEAAGFRADPG